MELVGKLYGLPLYSDPSMPEGVVYMMRGEQRVACFDVDGDSLIQIGGDYMTGKSPTKKQIENIVEAVFKHGRETPDESSNLPEDQLTVADAVEGLLTIYNDLVEFYENDGVKGLVGLDSDGKCTNCGKIYEDNPGSKQKKLPNLSTILEGVEYKTAIRGKYLFLTLQLPMDFGKLGEILSALAPYDFEMIPETGFSSSEYQLNLVSSSPDVIDDVFWKAME